MRAAEGYAQAWHTQQWKKPKRSVLEKQRILDKGVASKLKEGEKMWAKHAQRAQQPDEANKAAKPQYTHTAREENWSLISALL